LLDAEDERRDGKKTLSERGDLTAILEEYGVTLVMLLDALPEFLSASARSLALRLKSPGSSAVAEIEQSLRIREIRSAFAFNKVIAKKFHEFMAIHFDAESTEGKALARFRVGVVPERQVRDVTGVSRPCTRAFISSSSSRLFCSSTRPGISYEPLC
jgi:hypothetical protein